MEDLKTLIATRFLRIPHLYPLLMPLWKRLSRIRRRFKRALELGSAPSRLHASRAGQPRPAWERTTPALPQKFGWLIWALGWQAAGYAGHLEHLLQQPDVAAIIAACPRARRARSIRPSQSRHSRKMTPSQLPSLPQPLRPQRGKKSLKPDRRAAPTLGF